MLSENPSLYSVEVHLCFGQFSILTTRHSSSRGYEPHTPRVKYRSVFILCIRMHRILVLVMVNRLNAIFYFISFSWVLEIKNKYWVAAAG